MSMLERDLQDVNLESAAEADDDAVETVEIEAGAVDDSSDEAFEKALSREDRHHHHSLDATQIYLNEIGFSPLLTPEEEVHYGVLLARAIRRGVRE